MSAPKGGSVEDFVALVKTNMPDFYRVFCAQTADEFCSAIGGAVRHCLAKLEDRPKLLHGVGEVALDGLGRPPDLQRSTHVSRSTPSLLPGASRTAIVEVMRKA